MSTGPRHEEELFAILPEVRSMGVMLFDPRWAEQAHVAGSCELLHVLSGQVDLHLAGTRHHAGPGDLLLVPAGAEHRDAFDMDAGLQVFIVFFDWPVADAYFARVNNALLHGLPAARKADIALQVERMRRDRRGEGEVDRLVARGYLFNALMLMLREATEPAEAHSDYGRRRRALMLEARRYLDTHYARPITLDDIARALDVSAFYLSHVFSEESDFTLFGYLTTLRMDKARELLSAGRLTVAEVAQAVGYDSGNYFTKVFRKHFGHAPSEVRGS